MSKTTTNNIPFGCYYIDRNYLEYLHENGDERTPKSNYEDEDRARKFYCGPVYNDFGVNYYVPVSHETEKNQMSVYDPETKTVEYYGMYIRNSNNQKIGNLDFRFMVPCYDDKLLTPCDLTGYGLEQNQACLKLQSTICKNAETTYKNIQSNDYPWLNESSVNYDNVIDTMWSYDDEKIKHRKLIAEQLAATISTNDYTNVSFQLGN